MDGFTPKAVGMIDPSRHRVHRGRVAGFRMLNASASRVFASGPVLRLVTQNRLPKRTTDANNAW